MAEEQPPRFVALGRVLGAVGLRGWLKVQSFTDPPENLLQYKAWELADLQGRRTSWQVAEAQFDGRWARVRLAGVEDRDGAELLRGRVIDLAPADASQLGFSDLAPVDLTVLSMPVKSAFPR